MKKIVYLPLDERPCNYAFAGFLSEENPSFTLIRPDIGILGKKKIPADCEKINAFLAEECKDTDYLIVSTDMLLYGGIVPSRLHHLSEETLTKRLDVLKKAKEDNPSLKIYAFSLIMRCPSYSSADEEPDYYEECGREIFLYGQNEHKYSAGIIKKAEYEEKKKTLGAACGKYLDDYLARRKTNLALVKKCLALYEEKIIDKFVIPQDDSSPYGYTAIDWMNSKVIDTEEKHNFRDIVIGQENYHWTYNASTGYAPLSDHFSEKDTASYYLTGTNEGVYTQYWLARVKKQKELYRAWSEMMEDADEVGVYNVVDFAPPIADYTSTRGNIELYAQDQFYVMMVTDKGTGNLATYLKKFKDDGGSKATKAINDWYYGK